jgi:hypothetical protein
VPRLKGGSFDRLMGLERSENEVPFHSVPTNFKPKPDEIFCGLFFYHRITMIQLISMVTYKK